MQCILNCKKIMYFLINVNQPKNEIQMYFKQRFSELIDLYNLEKNEKFKLETSEFSLEILELLLKRYKRFNIYEQQSSSEFFLYLIEELGIENFFKIKHQINIHCKNCKNISSKNDESFHFEMFSDESDEYSVNIDNFIHSVNVIKDYKCDNCKTITNAVYEKTALNISTYFVILLNKYFKKIKIEYPDTFELSIQDTNLKQKCLWKNISQIEHLGNLDSGHYISICRRLRNIFIFDDDKVTTCESDCIKPTKNTYMIFYEKKY